MGNVKKRYTKTSEPVGPEVLPLLRVFCYGSSEGFASRAMILLMILAPSSETMKSADQVPFRSHIKLPAMSLFPGVETVAVDGFYLFACVSSSKLLGSSARRSSTEWKFLQPL